MNVLIVSDSHGLTTELEDIKQRHHCSTMIHCGDTELGMDAEQLEGFIKVGGNCDFDARYPLDHTVDIGGLTFYITHGHLHRVNSGLLPLAYKSQEKSAQIVCYGHTHVAGAEMVGNQLFINPGSIKQPRRHPDKTYAIMRWDTPKDIYIDFYHMDGTLHQHLSTRVTFN
ncbi:metallophosphoesterase family protein [Lentibacillus saliphilus]|uniref:metallophosphoesterase family protein n=1 Tax=Lentibacillus saliphilus TaxID=2737028 RepID=UPI001C30FFA7|nr:metallophosphoesterase [Lentibacillus saliphilus]